jgi:hypothetical protein
VEYAKELQSGKIVAATHASSWRSYVCPRPECRGRVYLAKGAIQRPHFRHFPGEGTDACEEYFPGSGADTGTTVRHERAPAVEEEPAALGLVLSDVDGHWTLGLRLPEISSDEFGDASLGSLRLAQLEVFAGQHRQAQVSALHLRPGVGAARVAVPPSVQSYRTQAVGTWPVGIDPRRWQLQCRGLDAKGTPFRLRNGEWTRLVRDSAVHQGETLLVLADKRSPPPKRVSGVAHFQTNSAGIEWIVWEVQIPEDLDRAGEWLTDLGYVLVARPWQLTLLTPPRRFTDSGTPIFWLRDTPVIRVEAPKRSAHTYTSVLSFDTNKYFATRKTDGSGVSYLLVVAQRPGLQRLTISDDARSSIDLNFVEQPAAHAQLESVAETPRLLIWVGDACLKAWDKPMYVIGVQPSAYPNVVAHLGDDTARARVTVWQRGLRRSYRGLSAQEVAKVVEDALCASGSCRRSLRRSPVTNGRTRIDCSGETAFLPGFRRRAVAVISARRQRIS